jgi:hypothetical protein
MYFDTLLVKPEKDEEVPFHPFVLLRVMSTDRDVEGRVTLGPQLMTEGEVDYLADRLLGELADFRRNAKELLSQRRV